MNKATLWQSILLINKVWDVSSEISMRNLSFGIWRKLIKFLRTFALLTEKLNPNQAAGEIKGHWGFGPGDIDGHFYGLILRFSSMIFV